MTTSFENGCTYCMAAHTTVSGMTGVPADVVESLRGGTAIADPKLNALANFTRALVQSGGAADVAVTDAFFAAGYTKAHALEVLSASRRRRFQTSRITSRTLQRMTRS